MSMGFKLLPAKKGTCDKCAVDHPPEHPHNCESLYYQYRFYFAHGRWPTWSDAIAHCGDELRQLWQQELESRNRWSSVESPVSEPYEVQS